MADKLHSTTVGAEKPSEEVSIFRKLVKPVHIELVKQNMMSEVAATEVIIFIQVLHLTQCSLQQNCETFGFIVLIMWNKHRQMQFAVPLEILESIHPRVIMVCHLPEHQSP